MPAPYDALIVVSFGGPEGQADVLPFLDNVLRGKNVPADRVRQVAEHYRHFGGVSPLNAQNRTLVLQLERELRDHGLAWPIYFGNRNWHPFLADTVRTMKDDGVRAALAFVTSAYSSYSGCRQYLEDIERARQTVGGGAPRVDKLRPFFNHPGFIESVADRAGEALARISPSRLEAAALVYTAHSIPRSMAACCAYETQLREAAGLVSRQLGRGDWTLSYQSRSGPPSQPWLEPDVLACLDKIRAAGHSRDVVLVPIGFVSDHLEVLWDLDVEARQCCQRLGLEMQRAATVGVHPRFITMIRELVEERLTDDPRRLALGTLGPAPDCCPADCCLP